jgi:hypothetical protein
MLLSHARATAFHRCDTSDFIRHGYSNLTSRK